MSGTINTSNHLNAIFIITHPIKISTNDITLNMNNKLIRKNKI